MFNCRQCISVRSNQNTQDDFNTLQKARLDLIGEIQAVFDYDEHINSTTNAVARSTWQNIKEEELVHIGELLALMEYLDPTQKQFVEQGVKEFNDRLNNQRRIRD